MLVSSLSISLGKNTRAASLYEITRSVGGGGAARGRQLEVALRHATTIGPKPRKRDGVAGVHSDCGRSSIVACTSAASLEGGVGVAPRVVGIISCPQVAPVVDIILGAREGVCSCLLSNEETL